MKNKKSLNEELLSKRVFFRDDTIRDEFFAKLKAQFGTWKELRKHFGIYKSRLEHLRDGDISIPYSTFLDLLSHLSTDDNNFFNKQIFLKDRNWGMIKGGLATYKKHRYIFEKGRKIGAKSARCGRYNFQFDTPLTPQLCELIGAFIGDGFTNKYGGMYMIQFTGHSKLDKEYIVETLKPIIKEMSPNSNPIITEKDNTMRMTIYSKEFYNLLTKRFKFPSGKKSYTVTIPDEIVNSEDQKSITNCIRGIYDTDGCIFYDKRKIYKTPYLRVQLGTVSVPLMNQVYNILKNLNLNPRAYINGRKHVIQINGFENVNKFIKEIGFSNKKHLDKIKDL
ncbi:MAG: LAGLIDADG family homing endonuclease [Candidatus Woesearchaeota archaeon]|nr:LAGLIDADG family homing endonuclease [Candidatus Woesearchaeota archaeon]